MTDAGGRPWDVDGPAGAPAIVFVHGSVLARQSWYPQIARLRDRYRCVTVDLPAHGALADVPFSLDAAVNGVIEAIDADAGGRAVVVGLSLGGYVAMAVAERSPERVRGLVIAGSSREPSGISAWGFRAFALALRVVPVGVINRLNARILRTRLSAEEATVVSAGGTWMHGGAHGVSTLAGRGFRERLLAYGGPILVINGDLDLVFRLGERRFLRGVPHVTKRHLRRTTHLSNLDRPAEFTAAVRAFVESIPA